MAQANNITMTPTGTAFIVLVILNIGHFITGTLGPIFTICSGVFILYNIRLHIVNAGGFIAYLKSWLKWKK